MSGLIEWLIEVLGRFVIATISTFGYTGIVITMAIESACIPLPSEIIMPFYGYLDSTGQFSLVGVTLAWRRDWECPGVVGRLLCGSLGWPSVCRAVWRYVLISQNDVDLADRCFAKHGEAAVLIGRLLPVVRTFISLPAGIARMDIKKFVLYSFVGAVPFCYALAYVGLKMGEHWNELPHSFHHADLVIGLSLAVGLGYFLWSHWPKRRGHRDPRACPRPG